MRGRNVLIVEDEYFLCDEIVMAFREAGARIVGPAATVEAAVALVERTPRIDAAVLDVRLRSKMSFAVARLLKERNVPFVFTTGYDGGIIPEELADVGRYEKPVDPQAILKGLSAALV